MPETWDFAKLLEMGASPNRKPCGPLRGSPKTLTASETTLTGDVTVTGQGMQVALNLALVLDMLEVIKTSHVRLKANAPNTPVVLTPEGDPGLLYVLMPMVGH